MYVSMYFWIFYIKSTPCSPPSAAVWTWWCSPCCRTEPAAHRSPCSCCVEPPSAWRRSPSPPSPQPQRRTAHCWRSIRRGKKYLSAFFFVIRHTGVCVDLWCEKFSHRWACSCTGPGHHSSGLDWGLTATGKLWRLARGPGRRGAQRDRQAEILGC